MSIISKHLYNHYNEDKEDYSEKYYKLLENYKKLKARYKRLLKQNLDMSVRKG